MIITSFAGCICPTSARPAVPPRELPTPPNHPPSSRKAARWMPAPGLPSPTSRRRRARSLSGIACPAAPAAPGLCLAVFDEGGEARYLTIDGETIRPDAERVVLIPGKVELDGEAAATDGTFYYVAGSHSAKRSDCETNPREPPPDPVQGRPRHRPRQAGRRRQAGGFRRHGRALDRDGQPARAEGACRRRMCLGYEASPERTA